MDHELRNNTSSTLSLSAKSHQQYWMYLQQEIGQPGHVLFPNPGPLGLAQFH